MTDGSRKADGSRVRDSDASAQPSARAGLGNQRRQRIADSSDRKGGYERRKRKGALSIEANRKPAQSVEPVTLTPEQARRFAVETVNLTAIDGRERGRATRVSNRWLPKTLYGEGRITQRAYNAARILRDLYDAGGFERIKGQAWQERVAGGSSPGVAQKGADARARFLRALERLRRIDRALVRAVVIDGLSATIIAGEAAGYVHAHCLPKSPAIMAAVLVSMIAFALEDLADVLDKV